MNQNPNSKLQILIMNPFSEYILKRSSSINQDDNGKYLTNTFYGYKEVINFCEQILAKLKIKTVNDNKNINRTIIKIYDCYPSYTYISIGYFSWFSPLWVYKSSMGGAAISVDLRRNTPLSETLRINFEKLWNDKSREISCIKELELLESMEHMDYMDYMKNKIRT
ncbi:MAG: hypothetical protein PQJ46_16410 [Spirochaetales bacterium]|nr:hypothetical protein [Spirochaetales bacterium]